MVHSLKYNVEKEVQIIIFFGGEMINTEKVKESKNPCSARKGKILNIIKKVLLCILVVAAVLLALVVIYQIVKVLFVLAILFIAWLRPGRW